MAEQPLLTDRPELESFLRTHTTRRERGDGKRQHENGSDGDGEGANHDGSKIRPSAS
jgi:hypothetical protein